MNKLSALFFSLLLLLCLPSLTNAQESGEKHIVEQGETLFSISREYDVTVGDLRRWNQLQSDELTNGQELLVGPPVREGAEKHRVESGQTLFSISKMYDVTIAEIQAWNGLSNINLEVGQELILYPDSREPVSEPSTISEDRQSIVRADNQTQSTTYYTVRSGDTLTRIAREHDMTVDEIRTLNDLDSDIISIGQRITVRDTQTAPSVDEGAEESTAQGRFVTYRVQSNETIESLRNKFKMSDSELSSLNPDINIAEISSGQRITVLLPPSRAFANPYKKRALLESLGSVPITVYQDDEIAKPTTNGELYNPKHLTAAHANMALGNLVFVENPNTGVGIYVRINDRHSGNGLKISKKAFEMLNFSSIQSARAAIYLDQ